MNAYLLLKRQFKNKFVATLLPLQVALLAIVRNNPNRMIDSHMAQKHITLKYIQNNSRISIKCLMLLHMLR